MAAPLTAAGVGRPVSWLVVGPSWVGDMVMAQSLFRVLRERDPSCVIDLVAPPWSVPVAERMPEVRRAIPLAVSHGALMLGERRRVARECRAAGYDRAIVLPRTLKSALVPWLAGVPRRTGYLGEYRWGLLNDVRRLDRAAVPRMVDRYVALGLDAGEPLPDSVPVPRLRPDLERAAAVLAREGVSERKGVPALALMPGAEYGPAKQWPMEKWSELVRTMVGGGVQCWLLGSAKDRAFAEAVLEGAGVGGSEGGGAGAGAGSSAAAFNLCGRTQLDEAVDLLAAADVAVTNDSGLMHVAAAVGCPLVAIFGSSTPNYTPPLVDDPATADAIWLGIECSPCFERTCPLGHLRCLRDIGVERVVDSARRALGGAAESRSPAPAGPRVS